jgi:hypothetical protein
MMSEDSRKEFPQQHVGAVVLPLSWIPWYKWDHSCADHLGVHANGRCRKAMTERVERWLEASRDGSTRDGRVAKACLVSGLL